MGFMQDCIKDLLCAINDYNPEDKASIDRLRDIVCVISDNDEMKKDPFVAKLLYTASQKMRVFGYNILNQYLHDPSIGNSNLDDLKDDIVKQLYRSHAHQNNILDKSQKEVIDVFQSIQPHRLLVSAPTSYGKTFLMREIVYLNNERYKIILLVFPTVALLQENASAMSKFVKDTGLDYQIVKSVDAQIDVSINTIFVFTPERALQLLAVFPNIQIDFFFFDEVYKIDEDYCTNYIDEKVNEIEGKATENRILTSERGKTFRIALYLFSKIVPDYYLAGPNLNKNKFGEGLKRYIQLNKITVMEFDFEPTLRIPVEAYGTKIVEKAPINFSKISCTAPVKINTHVHQKVSDVVTYISSNNYGKTLIYCTTPSKAIEYATKLAENTTTELHNYSETFMDFIDHIKCEYDVEGSVEQWSLIKVLNKGFGMHHGKLPKYIQQEILDQFNHGTFQVLFCTSTIVEGVNTDAKNIIIMNASKGHTNLTPFDIKNIKGRAGRYYHCFVGRVFYMSKELLAIEHSDELRLDFATYSEIRLGAIDLDNALIEDLSLNNQNRKLQRDEKNCGFKLPYEVFVKNRTVQKEDQEALLQYLFVDKNFRDFYGLITHSVDVENFLHYGWLNKILKAFMNAGLINERIVNKYSAVSIKYQVEGFKGLLKYAICNSKNIDVAYSTAFRTLREIIEQNIPRILSLFESIIIYVATCKDFDMSTFSLSRVAHYYETGVKSILGENLIEYGFPLDAIRRLESHFSIDEFFDLQNAKDYCLKNKSQINQLLDKYEQKLFYNFLKG